MNRNGAVMFIILMSVCYFMFGMIVYQFLKPDIAITRTDLKCSAPDTAGDMMTCLIVDGVVPLFIIGILSTAGGAITERALR